MLNQHIVPWATNCVAAWTWVVPCFGGMRVRIRTGSLRDMIYPILYLSYYRYTLIGVNTGLCDEFVPEFFTNLYFHDGLAWIHYIFYTNNNNKCEDFGFIETPGSTTTEKPDHQVSIVLLGGFNNHFTSLSFIQ